MGATYIKVRKYGRFYDWAKKYNYKLEVLGENGDEVVFQFTHKKYGHAVLARRTKDPSTWYQVHVRYNGDTSSKAFRAQLRLKQILFAVDTKDPVIPNEYSVERRWTKGGNK